MGNKLTPKVILEGTRLTFKTKSMLPSLTLDVSDNNIPRAVECVADWLEASGGLYMPN